MNQALTPLHGGSLNIYEGFKGTIVNQALTSLHGGSLNIYEGFKGTIVNRALTSLHGGSLNITLTVPVSKLGRDEVIQP